MTIPPLIVDLNGSSLELSTNIYASQIITKISGETNVDINTLKNTVHGHVAMLADSLGWAKGYGYEVEITGIGSAEAARVFGIEFEGLDPLSGFPGNAIGIIDLLLKDSENKLLPLRRALKDFRQGILDPQDTPFYAFRSVEALMHYFGTNAKKGRKKLCAELNLTNEWIIDQLEKPAGELRHGKAKNITGTERLHALRAARLVISRFIEYVHQGGHLSKNEFPTMIKISATNTRTSNPTTP